jgi:F-type H+-transporting ATPase subunit gamma
MAGGLKEVRNRIASVGSTRQITQAMKLVSAAKLRRAQDAITQMRPYAEKLQEILVNVSGSLDASENPYAVEREAKKVLLVAITSNRGLCGPFNNNIIKLANQRLTELKEAEVHVLCLGKKAGDVFRRTSNFTTLTLGDTPHEIFDHLDFAHTSDVAQVIMDAFRSGEYDRVELLYNRFVNAAVQDVRCEQMLPIQQGADDAEGESSKEVDYIFEPSREEIASNIVPNTLKIQLYKALLDSHASEHGARMTAMHKATENAGELLRDLKLSYNKARQAAITAEILEIVGGAEALEG